MGKAGSRICGGIGCIIVLAIAGVLIWLLVKHRYPSFYVDQFSVFSRQETTNSLKNYTVHYDLRIKNNRHPNDNLGIYYDALNVTFYYKQDVNSFPIKIGDATFSPFYIRRYRSTHRAGSFDARGVKLENGTASPVIFRVELSTAVRYRKPLWKGKRHRMVVGADFKVNDQGSLINKEVKLKSNAKRNGKVRLELMGILGILVFILSL
ncbi:protein NDR1-like [Chenopodium quinoa]|uniref:protein NDR1-like n=1 Tax=Chenopodium quinoa TaxID=63459 RepID=UPI000B76F1CC|nr:protein NDR1-like [Chenopodium quinoa]